LIGGGTVGSRSLMSHGAALYGTAQEVVKKGLDFAAKELEVSKADLEFSAGKYRVKGTDLSIAFSEIVKRHGAALDTQGGIPTPIAFPGGAHVCEVETIPNGTVEVASYVAVDDCGRVNLPWSRPAPRRYRAGNARRSPALRLRRRWTALLGRSWNTHAALGHGGLLYDPRCLHPTLGVKARASEDHRRHPCRG
jgi:hypothetical protein